MTHEHDTHWDQTTQMMQVALLSNPEAMKNIIQDVLQWILQERFKAFIGTEPYERSGERTGYRNGHYSRELMSRVGTLTLRVPRDREGLFEPRVFERYQRSEQALFAAIAESYLAGVSTRKVTKIVEELCGVGVSKSQVSACVKKLDQDLEAWRTRPLEKPYPYLMIDARYNKVRVENRVVSMASLVVIGLCPHDGSREILGCAVANSEDEVFWGNFFQQLFDRGLHGVKYVVSDAHRGLKNALERHFQGVVWQRCQVHLIRNFIEKLSRAKGAWLTLLKDVFEAPTKEEALRRGKQLINELRLAKKVAVAEWLEAVMEESLAVYVLPEAHRKKMRSTNMIERFNQELKRRTQVARIFPSVDSLLRLLTALCQEQSEEWSCRRWLVHSTA